MKKLLIGTASVLAITLVSILNVASNTGANFDELGIQQELTNHGERLDNHEDRITNTEKDVKDVQDKTGVSPSTERIIVREVVTQLAEKKQVSEISPVYEEPESPPIVTVKNFEVITIDEKGNQNCKLIYSDDTTYERVWKTVRWDGTHKITSTSGVCDSSMIGKEKRTDFSGYMP